jgi:hypothetical protein
MRLRRSTFNMFSKSDLMLSLTISHTATANSHKAPSNKNGDTKSKAKVGPRTDW